MIKGNMLYSLSIYLSICLSIYLSIYLSNNQNTRSLRVIPIIDPICLDSDEEDSEEDPGDYSLGVFEPVMNSDTYHINEERRTTKCKIEGLSISSTCVSIYPLVCLSIYLSLI